MIVLLIFIILNNICMLLTIIATFFMVSKMTNNFIKTPVEVLKEAKEKKQIKKQADKDKTILQQNLENIENYNGTPYGQKDFK